MTRLCDPAPDASSPRSVDAAFPGRAGLLALAVAVAASAVPPAPAAAQELKGRVVDAGAGTPVQGAMTALLDSAGTRVASTLTGPDGA